MADLSWDDQAVSVRKSFFVSHKLPTGISKMGKWGFEEMEAMVINFHILRNY